MLSVALNEAICFGPTLFQTAFEELKAVWQSHHCTQVGAGQRAASCSGSPCPGLQCGVSHGSKAECSMLYNRQASLGRFKVEKQTSGGGRE